MTRSCFLSGTSLLCLAASCAFSVESGEPLLSGCQASEFELVGQAALGDSAGKSFGVDEYLADEAVYLCFSSRAGHEEGVLGHMKIAMRNNEQLVFGTCFVDGVNDQSVFAVMEMNAENEFMGVRDGWRFDLSEMIVRRISAEQLKCIDY